MKVVLNFLIVLFSVILIFVGLLFSVKSFKVFDISMQPSFQPGDYILVNRLEYLFNQPGRGDVIALYPPETDCPTTIESFFNPACTQYIKRIIAIPGDTVEVKDQKVYVNGRVLQEPYIQEAAEYSLPPQSIPQGEYFVLGDDRNNSDDSHRGWLAPATNIIGKVSLCYWKAGYPNIHLAMIPLLVVIVGVLSLDLKVGKANNSRIKQVH